MSNHSSSVRFVCDLSEINRPWIISDTGNSGKWNSKFYDNFLNQSENGELIQLSDHDWEDVENVDLNMIVLRNSKGNL